MHFSRRRHAVRGVTLMEVLFSIGIVTIGLLGVITLLPLASRYVGKGTTAGNMSVLGQNARHELYSRQLSNPEFWRVNNHTADGAVLVRNPTPFPAFPGLYLLWNRALPLAPASYAPLAPNTAFCIDPRFVATEAPAPTGPVNPALMDPAQRPGQRGFVSPFPVRSRESRS